MSRSLLLVAWIAVSIVSIRNVQARSLPEYDMASLWYQSEVVVEGEQVGGQVRISLIHKGEQKVAKGEAISVNNVMFRC
jgi:hypothetical protein